jgi:hypothetical protein
VIKLILEFDALFFHIFDREISNRHVVLFQTFNIASQTMVSGEQLGKMGIAGFQGMNSVVQFRKIVVKTPTT